MTTETLTEIKTTCIQQQIAKTAFEFYEIGIIAYFDMRMTVREALLSYGLI